MASCGVLHGSSASDELLARSVRDGDEHAFELLYERYSRPLRRYAGRLLRDPAAGEDAAQVALANAYRALRAGQTPRSVRPWLYRIAQNAAWGLRTGRAEHVELTPALEPHVEPQPGDTATLSAAVARLPERQRAVFALRELRGASNRETADILGLRESQVEQLLFAGRARLAELLLYGDTLSCEDVRVAAARAELGRDERRALKRHAHHCDDCRALLGGRLRLGARLLAPAEALRRLLDLALGLSAPAKVGAAAAITIAASSPFVLPPTPARDEPIRREPPTAAAPATKPEPATAQVHAALLRAPSQTAPSVVHVPARVGGTMQSRPWPEPAATQPVPRQAAPDASAPETTASETSPTSAPATPTSQPVSAAPQVVPAQVTPVDKTPRPETRAAPPPRPAAARVSAPERPAPVRTASLLPADNRTPEERAPLAQSPADATRQRTERAAQPVLVSPPPESAAPAISRETAAPLPQPAEPAAEPPTEPEPESDPTRPTR